MDWIQAISTVGFPICSFLIAAYFIKYSYDKSNEMYTQSIDKIGKLANAVNNNTMVLTELVKKLDGSDDIK
jgi:hypothetical protein